MSPRPTAARLPDVVADAERAPDAPLVTALRSTAKSTINDVARMAGVSKKTVSRVINDSPLVRPDTRDKILALMRQIGYAPDPQARGLAFRRSFLIGLVFDNPTAQYIVNMQYGALDALRDSGFELVVHPCDSKSEGYIEGIQRFAQQQKLWGLILIPRVSEDQALADALQEIGCRYVRIASIPLDEPARMLLTHDRLAGGEVADYFESLGHRHFGLITGPRRYRSSIERGGGFTEALARRGIELSAEQVYEGGYTFESGVAGAERLLSRSPRPTAIFACNDEMAAGVYKAALRMGLSIPGDLSVIGYDDSPLASQLWPALTTIRLPVRDLGRQAASMLLASDPPARGARPASIVAVTPHLMVRDSCQPPQE
jgi:LacI family transcriptional regulator